MTACTGLRRESEAESESVSYQHTQTRNIPATIQSDKCTMGVVLDLTDWAVAVDLLVQSLGNVLHHCTQRAVQDQVAVTCTQTHSSCKTCMQSRWRRPELAMGSLRLKKVGSKMNRTANQKGGGEGRRKDWTTSSRVSKFSTGC